MTSFLSRTLRFSTKLPAQIRTQTLTTSSSRMAATLNSETISKIQDAEKKVDGKDEPIAGGPTAQAQSQAGQSLNSQTIHNITEGEKKLAGDHPVKGGPTATAQSILAKERGASSSPSSTSASGRLDSETISKITEAEKELTGQDDPVKGGPTAKAQSHAGQTINSQTLHDITEGEKNVTGGERVKGGPTATAQSELSKAQ